MSANHLHFISGDTSANLNIDIREIHGILAAPPCTQFSKANTRLTRSQKDFTEGMRIVRQCLEIIWCAQMKGAPLHFWALENPQGYLSRFLGKSVFRFQHWEFGETRQAMATKRTEIWGYFNAPIVTVRKRPVPIIGKGKVNKGWSSLSVEKRAETCEGFAHAFFKANNH